MAETEAIRSHIILGDKDYVNKEVPKWLREHPTSDQRKDLISCLADAILEGYEDIVSKLLYFGVPFTLNQVELAVQTKSKPILSLFLDHGWNINEAPRASTPPLLCAAIDDLELTKWLLSKGAEPNASAETVDCTCLSVAVSRAPLAVIRLLFEHGGDPHRGQLLHYAAARMAADRTEVLAFILDMGATGLNELMYEKQPSYFATMAVFGLGTPLHVAAEKGFVGAVQFLLEHGADPTIKNSTGELAVERAVRMNHLDVVAILTGH